MDTKQIEKQLLEREVSGEITEKDLKLVKHLNNLELSGEVHSVEPRELELGFFGLPISKQEPNFVGYDLFKFNLIGILLNWTNQKFDWKGFEDDRVQYELERLLFVYGKAMIFQNEGELWVSHFTTKTFDFYHYPKTITPVFPNGEMFTRSLTVDKDCVIIYNDKSWPFSKSGIYGTLWRIWPILNQITKTWKYIDRNLLFQKQWLAIEFGADPKHIQSMKDAFEQDNEYIMEITNQFMTKLTAADSNRTLTFEDKTPTVWENYYNYKEELKWHIGIETNANLAKKERQVSQEITVQNEIPWSQMEIKIKVRKEAVEKINKIFGTSVSVELNVKEDDMLLENENSQGDNNDSNSEQ